MSVIQPNPLLGRVAPAVTPVRTGGVTGLVGSFGPTRRNADGSVHEHKGIDLLSPLGWPVWAVHEGVVILAGWENENDSLQGYGKRVWVESSMRTLKTVYAHLSAIRVKVGDHVGKETILGTTGRTGNVGQQMSVPTHLHFETLVGDGKGNWTPVDPEKWLMGLA